MHTRAVLDFASPSFLCRSCTGFSSTLWLHLYRPCTFLLSFATRFWTLRPFFVLVPFTINYKILQNDRVTIQIQMSVIPRLLISKRSLVYLTKQIWVNTFVCGKSSKSPVTTIARIGPSNSSCTTHSILTTPLTRTLFGSASAPTIYSSISQSDYQ